jgi:tyrosinase
MDSIYAFTLFLSLIFCSHSLASLHGVRKYDYRYSTNLRFHKREFSQSSIVGGLPLVDGQPQQRLEIRDLQKDDDQWNLYILALSWMQYTPQDSPFSWYQIAGRLPLNR